MLVISKAPEFSESGEVLPGQCEPYTGGWRMRLINEGRDEVLLTGTYVQLRRVQKRCIDKGIDEIRAVAAEAKEGVKRAARAQAVPADPNEATQILAADEVRQALAAMESDHIPPWIELSEREELKIARIWPTATPSAVDVGATLKNLIESPRKGLILDVSAVSPEPEVVKKICEAAEKAAGSDRIFGLLSASDDLKKALEAQEKCNAVRFFPDLEAALEAAREGPPDEAATAGTGEDSPQRHGDTEEDSRLRPPG